MFELGTYEHPFKLLESASKEVFNWVYEPQSNVTILIKRGTSFKGYYLLQMVYILNLNMFNISTYGNPSLPNPRLFHVDWSY